MDFQLQQWGDRHESDHHSAKIPKLFESHHEQQQHDPSSASPLPLFASEPTGKISDMSAVPDSSPRFSRMGSYFSLTQWQELELQALIYKYLLVGAAVPSELLQPIKKSLLHAPHYFLHNPLQHYQHYQPALLQSGYWGRAAVDPEPGRCRRTDGKKWRCSRDVVAGQKYCERHIHRGRNRSRKPVEINTSTTPGGPGVVGGCGSLKQTNNAATYAQPLSTLSGASHFDFSRKSSSMDLLHLNHSSGEAKDEDNALFESRNEIHSTSDGGHILRPFFDDWPRSLQESENVGSNSSSRSATSLSIAMPNNSSSDVSLKLATGNGYELGARDSRSKGEVEHEHQQLNWAASMGGPLAEALRSST